MDLGVFGQQRTIDDYLRAEEEFNLRKQQAQNEAALRQAQIQKAQQPDYEQLGMSAFYKAAQGLPLTPEENAAAMVLDSIKGGGLQFDPVTGAAMQKPRISDRIPLQGMQKPPLQQSTNMAGNIPIDQNEMPVLGKPSGTMTQEQATGINDLYGEGIEEPQETIDPLEASYQREVAGAANNPKLRQEIESFYSKKRMEKSLESSESGKNKQVFSDSLQSILSDFDQLNQMGSVVSTQSPLAQNLKSRAASTALGQEAQRWAGTEEQVLRDALRSKERILLQAFKKATGMTATEINSNQELKTALEALISPTTGYESAYAIAENLDKSFGLGSIDQPQRPQGRTMGGGQLGQEISGLGGVDIEQERAMAMRKLQSVSTTEAQQKVRQRFFERTGERLD